MSEELPLFETLDPTPPAERKDSHGSGSSDDTSDFGKYIVYVDESGDHGMQSIDEHYPLNSGVSAMGRIPAKWNFPLRSDSPTRRRCRPAYS